MRQIPVAVLKKGELYNQSDPHSSTSQQVVRTYIVHIKSSVEQKEIVNASFGKPNSSEAAEKLENERSF